MSDPHDPFNFTNHKRRMNAAAWIDVLGEGADWIVFRERGRLGLTVPTERGLRGVFLG